MMSVRLSLPLLMATLAPSLTPTAAEDTTSPLSVVSVYVPGYQTKNWNGLAGSVISTSTTAATCTEYSSFGAEYTRNNITGPTETSRTVTYSGSEVQWGTLRLSSTAPASNTAQVTGSSPVETIDPSDTAWYFPQSTSTSAAQGRRQVRSTAVLSFAIMVAALML
ncbi:hypothetical protein SLS53_000636 [Cytospora paraplurivora]|uniref:Uncharacterized protein n=1 Tax=Cytospora paraplurivora TaxID=2898453 RepID=A0AAN9UL99_9PEZI